MAAAAAAAAAPDDTLAARISADCPADVQAILRAAWRHDGTALKPLLSERGKASCRDPVTGETPLHAAIRSMGPATVEEEGGDEDSSDNDEAARKTVDQLLFAGAIWNDLDDRNETPGCVAWRLRRKSLYEQLVRAGMRAEMLFAVMDAYEALGSDDAECDDDEMTEEKEEEEGEGVDGANAAEAADEPPEAMTEADMDAAMAELDAAAANADASDTAAAEDTPYLESHLTLADGKLMDAAGNGVMMAWETDIMRRSVDALLGPAGGADESCKGKRVLNIGFGLGIIDSLIAARGPARHHIVEAHPEVLARIDAASVGKAAETNGTNGTTAAEATAATAANSGAENASAPITSSSSDHAAEFGAAWEAAGPEPGAFRVHRGRWQDVVPRLLAEGELYDAVYFDTFGEDYSELRRFFTDYIPGLLDDGGVFGFFHGLGADRRICYDVYTRVVELHLSEAGLDVEWQQVPVDLGADGLDAAGRGAWQGILRPYWTLDTYRLPVCTFMG